MIAWLIGSKIGRGVSMISALIGALIAAWFVGRREGKAVSKAKQLEDAAERRERGLNAVEELQNGNPDRDDLVERLRSNHTEW